MGMNPFMPGGFGAPHPYGAMQPPAPLPTPSALNNPFADTPFVGQRMENDPLNELTQELLGAKPK